MGLDIKRIFLKTPPMPKEQILRRVAEIKEILSRLPEWLVRERGLRVVTCPCPEDITDIPVKFTRTYYEKGPHDYRSEKRKSSEIRLTPFFVIPRKEMGLGTMQLFCKRKERLDVKQIWEYLMLDLWSHLLRLYTQSTSITLKAPSAVTIEGDNLYMAFETGTIGDRLHEDFPSYHEIILPFGDLTLYQAFALHLGALAHVKEAEELKHGDYQLRHTLFDPGGLLNGFYHYVMLVNKMRGRPTAVNHFLTTPSLSVTDIEHALRAPSTEVQQENDTLLIESRAHAAGHGFKPSDFEKAYRDGYDLIHPQNAVQRFVDWQYERWGISVDSLY